jgi:hypothetical protein
MGPNLPKYQIWIFNLLKVYNCVRFIKILMKIKREIGTVVQSSFNTNLCFHNATEFLWGEILETWNAKTLISWYVSEVTISTWKSFVRPQFLTITIYIKRYLSGKEKGHKTGVGHLTSERNTGVRTTNRS